MNALRVLLITRECLRSDSNEGNVLLNLFAGQPIELANIYCKPGLPDSETCAHYFQLTDLMAFNNLLHKTPMGRRVASEGPVLPPQGAGLSAEKENKGFYDFFRSHNLTVFHCARELLWKLADFKSQALDDFVTDFAPDVIFAPLCYSMFVLAIHRYVIQLSRAPAVTYLYDDLYSLRQFRLSPLYWANRFWQRAVIRKTLPYYQYAYTMTEQQANEYSRMLAIPMKVLRKGAKIQQEASPLRSHEGVRLIYAGGLYYGRDKTLGLLADAVRALRREGIPVCMDIYTASTLSASMRSELEDGEGCAVHPVVSLNKLQQLYRESDIALHVESFQIKNAFMTRLSFSTKIVDCLASGCAVLAVCPDINAGWQYLRDEDAAVCISEPHEIEAAVRGLVCDSAQRDAYTRKALSCLLRNHEEQANRQGLLMDLTAVAEWKEEKR